MKSRDTPAIDDPEARPSLWTLLFRALNRYCPRCGQARLFRGYLQQVETCASCSHPWGEVRADDAPPWLTILLVGHIMAPFAISAAQAETVPHWVSVLWILSLATLLVLLILPFAKSLFIAIIWYVRAESTDQ